MVYVYAHTSSTLFRVDPDTLAVQQVAPFGWGTVGSDQMTDIAIDRTGRMIGVSFDRVYRVDPTTAQTTLLSSSLSGTFNGLSFVPASMLGQTSMPGDDVLVGTRNSDGKVFRIDPMSGSATEVGNMGSYQSSGDLVAVEGFGTAQTVTGSSSDVLARLAPQTFAATPIGGGTGYGQIWGIAYWKNKVYGFTNGGQFLLIDPTTGVATMVAQQGMAWWGAAVTTLAPVLQ
jgi:large repetitive protein